MDFLLQNAQTYSGKMVGYGRHYVPSACGKSILGHEVQIWWAINQNIVINVFYLLDELLDERSVPQIRGGLLFEHLQSRKRTRDLAARQVFADQVYVAGDEVYVQYVSPGPGYRRSPNETLRIECDSLQVALVEACDCSGLVLEFCALLV